MALLSILVRQHLRADPAPCAVPPRSPTPACPQPELSSPAEPWPSHGPKEAGLRLSGAPAGQEVRLPVSQGQVWAASRPTVSPRADGYTPASTSLMALVRGKGRFCPQKVPRKSSKSSAHTMAPASCLFLRYRAWWETQGRCVWVPCARAHVGGACYLDASAGKRKADTRDLKHPCSQAPLSVQGASLPLFIWGVWPCEHTLFLTLSWSSYATHWLPLVA